MLTQLENIHISLTTTCACYTFYSQVLQCKKTIGVRRSVSIEQKVPKPQILLQALWLRLLQPQTAEPRRCCKQLTLFPLLNLCTIFLLKLIRRTLHTPLFNHAHSLRLSHFYILIIPFTCFRRSYADFCLIFVNKRLTATEKHTSLNQLPQEFARDSNREFSKGFLSGHVLPKQRSLNSVIERRSMLQWPQFESCICHSFLPFFFQLGNKTAFPW